MRHRTYVLFVSDVAWWLVKCFGKNVISWNLISLIRVELLTKASLIGPIQQIKSTFSGCFNLSLSWARLCSAWYRMVCVQWAQALACVFVWFKIEIAHGKGIECVCWSTGNSRQLVLSVPRSCRSPQKAAAAAAAAAIVSINFPSEVITMIHWNTVFTMCVSVCLFVCTNYEASKQSCATALCYHVLSDILYEIKNYHKITSIAVSAIIVAVVGEKNTRYYI